MLQERELVLSFAGDQLLPFGILAVPSSSALLQLCRKRKPVVLYLRQHVAHSETACIFVALASMRFSTRATHRAAYSCCSIWEQYVASPTSCWSSHLVAMVLKESRRARILKIALHQACRTFSIKASSYQFSSILAACRIRSSFLRFGCFNLSSLLFCHYQVLRTIQFQSGQANFSERPNALFPSINRRFRSQHVHPCH
jgi:hypothetical protein